MKRSPLKRKTPLKRGTSQLKRTPLNRVSKSKSSTDKRKKYEKAKKEYMHDRASKKHHCERCEGLFGIENLDLHHKAGRTGSSMNDEGVIELNYTNKRTFSAVCRTCHDWIHRNPKQAREENWLI